MRRSQLHRRDEKSRDSGCVRTRKTLPACLFPRASRVKRLESCLDRVCELHIDHQCLNSRLNALERAQQRASSNVRVAARGERGSVCQVPRALAAALVPAPRILWRQQ